MATDQALRAARAPAATGLAALAGTRTLVAVIFLVALVPLLSTPLLPFIDLYNHLARYFVLSHLDTMPLLRQNYASAWSLLPNIGLDVIGTIVLRVLPPQYAAHLAVTAIFAVQYSGLLYFNRALTGRLSPLVALLVVPLLYSFILNWGFANFLLGLGLVFWAAGWWLSHRRRLVVALPVACVLAILIFLVHGLAFALYGVLVGSIELGLFLVARPRRVGVLARSLAALLVQAIVPVVMFMAAATSHSEGGVSNASASVARLAGAGQLGTKLWDLFCYRLTTIVRVEEGPALWLDVATFVLQLAIVGALLWRRRLAVAPAARVAVGVGLVLVAVVPPAMFGVGYVADRMPLFLAMLFVASLVPRLRGDAADRAAVAALGVIVAVRLVAITLGWQDYARDYAQFRQVATAIPPGSLVYDVVVGGSPRLSDQPRCLMYRPLLVSLYGQIGPLFANETQQPLRLIGRLRTAASGIPPGFASGNSQPGYYDDVVAAAGPAGFGYLLICNVERLTRPFPAGSAVVARTPRFTLLRVAR